MKEYGGYIEFEYFHGHEFHENAIALNSGRHGMEYLIRAKNIKCVYLPFFLCNTVSDICKKNGVEVKRYHIDKNLRPVLDFEILSGEWLYVVNYYGQIYDSEIKNIKAKYENLIVDNIQAFFQKPVEGIDTIYTCRKFFGVADGGYLYTDARLENIELDYSYDRMEFLFGRLEKSANEFYLDYVSNNRNFKEQDVKHMSKTTQNLMRGLDYAFIQSRRNINFCILSKAFKNINQLNLTKPEGAFMYPLLIDNGVEVRKLLQAEKIYIPTLWPDVFDICSEDTVEYQLAKNILPLPVDQRYDEDDMRHIIGQIKKYLEH